MNRFAILDTSDNEEETPKVSTQKKVKEDTSNKAPKKEAAGKQPSTKTSENKVKDVAPVSKEINKANEGKSKAAVIVEADVAKEDNRGGHPRNGRHGERPHPKSESQEDSDKPRRQKREFERRSGTGRGREVSRGGRGPYGAGNPEQEAQDAEKDPKSAETDAVEPVQAEEATPLAENVPETEPEPVTFTLDEYLQKRNNARATSSILTEVKQSRAVDVTKQFAGLTTKEESADIYIASKVSKGSSTKKDQRSTNKSVLDVEFSFEAPRRREYDNKGRGGGKFGGRGGNFKKNAPTKVFDQGEFPSL